MAAVPLRGILTRRPAGGGHVSKDGPQARRLLTVAAIYDGATRSEAAKIGGVTLQIVRDWVLSFQRRRPGWPCRSQGAGTAVAFEGRTSRRRWRAWSRTARRRRSMASCAGGSSISANGCSRSSAYPCRNDHEPRAARDGLSQAIGAAAPSCAARRRDRRVQKNFPARLEEIAREKGVDARDIEIWFADEARVGQKNKLTRRWAKRGSRPSAPKDQRTASTYIFGAISPRTARARPSCCPNATPMR